jgi:hypothetical protein
VLHFDHFSCFATELIDGSIDSETHRQETEKAVPEIRHGFVKQRTLLCYGCRRR